MTSPRENSGGYVMFLVVAVIALLAIVLVTTARVQSGLSRPLRALREAAAQELAIQSISARTAFLLLTEPIGPRSIIIGGARAGATSTGRNIRELRLDGRPYAAASQEGLRDAVFVSVQDEDGLLSLNAGDDPALGRLIEGVGVPRQGARGLAAALNDYVDEDDLVRQYGAERDTYLRARLTPPGNRPLQAPWEAARAIGWRNALSDHQRDTLWALTSAPSSGNALNVNTAPRPVLEAVLGDARMTRNLIERREQAEVRTLDDVQGLTGAQTRADGVVLAAKAGTAFRLVIAFGRSPDAARRYIEGQLKLADTGADRPIYWRNVRRIRTAGGAWEGRDRGNGSERIPDSTALPAS